ncbi:MAG TPA: STAS domain-containing protein [Acidimicrobiales bacterium]|nr:STAS domain-containing protein [Acidimicrobiales bacterium]
MERGCEIVLHELPGSMVIELRGNIDCDAASDLTAAYDGGRAGSDARRLVLDFSPAEYINSSGIALIVSILARARAEGRTVAAIGLSDHYRHIFEITRLSDFIEVCADLETALAPG